MNKNKTTYIALTGIFAAAICLSTAYIKIPIVVGYIHPGDSFIFLGAALIGVYGVFAAAAGSFLADILAGYPMYAIASLFIKGIMALVIFVILKNKKGKYLHCIISLFAAEIIMVSGYFIFECFLYDIEAAFAAVTFNALQGFISIVLGVLLVPVMKLKNIFNF